MNLVRLRQQVDQITIQTFEEWEKRYYEGSLKCCLHLNYALPALVDVYGKHGSVPLLNCLLARLQDVQEDWRVRVVAIEALGHIGKKAETVVPVLTQCLKNPDVRREALSTLGQIGKKAPQRVVPVLIQCLEQADYGDLQLPAIKMLGQIGEKAEPAVPALTECLKENNRSVRREALSTLGQIGKKAPQRVVPVLIQCLEQADYGDLQLPAIKMLGQIGEKAEPAVPALTECLKENNRSVRREALSTLGQIGKKAETVVPVLTQCLKNPDVRLEALSPPGQTGGQAEPTVSVLIQCLKQADYGDLYLPAIKMLGQIGEKAEPAVPALIECLGRSNVRWYARVASIEALRQIGGEAVEKAVPTLIKCLQNSDVRSAALSALNQIGEKAAAEAVAALIQWFNSSTKYGNDPCIAIEALGQIGGEAVERAVPILIECLQNRRGRSIRKYAVVALWKWQQERALRLFVQEAQYGMVALHSLGQGQRYFPMQKPLEEVRAYLRKKYENEQNARKAKQILCILHKADGKEDADIASTLYVDVSVVRDWVARYRAHGLKAFGGQEESESTE